jgi:hypothetical protein
MLTRTIRKTVVFARPFLLASIGRVLPAGDYRVATDEELIEGLSFAAYRRLSTVIFVPAQRGAGIEMLSIEPSDLQAAQDRDAATHLVVRGTTWPIGRSSSTSSSVR